MRAMEMWEVMLPAARLEVYLEAGLLFDKDNYKEMTPDQQFKLANERMINQMSHRVFFYCVRLVYNRVPKI